MAKKKADPSRNANSPEICWPDLEQFLAVLAGSELLTFQAFGSRNRVWHGCWPEPKSAIGREVAAGQNVCLMIARGNGKGRKSGDVLSFRAVFVDLDGAPLTPVLDSECPPNIVVCSSHDRYHCYWLLAGNLNESQYRELQRALARKFDGDIQVCDPPRVMRVPGVPNQKRGGELVRLQSANGSRRYTRDQLIEQLELAPFMMELATTGSSEGASHSDVESRNCRLFDLACGFRDRGLSIDACLARLLQHNSRSVKPPLAVSEVETVVRSAYTGGVSRLPAVMIPAGVVLGLEINLSLSETWLYVYCQIRRRGSDRPFTLIPEDQDTLSPATFRRAIKGLLTKGVLVSCGTAPVQRVGHCGRPPKLYRIAAKFLP